MNCATNCDVIRVAQSIVGDCGVFGAQVSVNCPVLVEGCTIDPKGFAKLSYFDTYSKKWVKSGTEDYEGFAVIVRDWPGLYATLGGFAGGAAELYETHWSAEEINFQTVDQYNEAIDYLREILDSLSRGLPSDEQPFIFFGVTISGGVRIFTIGAVPENTTRLFFGGWNQTASGGVNSTMTINETRTLGGDVVKGPIFFKLGDRPVRILQQVLPYAPINSIYSKANQTKITSVAPFPRGSGALMRAGATEGTTYGFGRWDAGPRRVPFFDFLAYYHSNPTTPWKDLAGCPKDEVLMGLIEYGWDKDQAKKLIQDTQAYYTKKWKEGVSSGRIKMPAGWNGSYATGEMPVDTFYDLMEERMVSLRDLNVRSLAQKIIYNWYTELLAAQAAGDEAAIQALYETDLFIPEEYKESTIKLVDHVKDRMEEEKREILIENLKKYTPRILTGLGILAVLGGGYFIYKRSRA